MKMATAMAVACLSVVGIAAGEDAQAMVRHYDLNIARQSLDAALRDLAQQTGLQIALFSDSIDGNAVVGPILGNQSAEEALKTLLTPSGLSYRVVSEGTIAVLNPKDSPPPVSGATGAAKRTSLWDRIRVSQATVAPQEQTEDSPATPTDDKSEVTEIVVTAQKREERLQDVPISISVLEGKVLSRSTERGVAEALTRIPGVSTQISTTATRLGSSGGVVVIRGVPTASGVSSTAYYLDSVPFGFIRPGSPTQAPDASGYDLERVEVLRGPQGTLYGSSALNGVVRVLSKDADLHRLEFSGRSSMSSTQHGDLNYRGDAMVNVPLVDGKLALRAVAGYQYLDGWIDKSIEKNANDAEIQNYRLKISFQPTEALSIEPMLAQYRADTGAPSNSADGRVSLSTLTEPSTIRYTLYGLELGYDFDAVALTSSTSYFDYINHSSFDYEPFGLRPMNNVSELDSEIFSQEVRLDSRGGGAWRWSVGAFYRDAKDVQLLSRREPGTGVLVNPPYRAVNLSQGSSESFAVFGELTRAFRDGKIELTAGLRYFEDRVRAREVSRQSCFTGIPGSGNCTAANPAPLTVLSDRFDNVTPRVVLAWKPTNTLNVYTSYSEGFRSGFPQAFLVQQTLPGVPPVSPDSLANYEIGAKGSAFDHRVNFDAAVYYIDWSDVPVSRTIDASALFGAPFLLGITDNGGSAEGVGAELGISAAIATDIILGANLAWNALEIAKDTATFAPNGTPAILYSKGERLPESAEYSLGFTADYSFELGSGLTGTLSGSTNYISEIVTSRIFVTNTNLVGGPATIRDGFWMSRVSAGIETRGGWRVRLFVDNLANQSAFSPDQNSPRWHSWARPRTTGLQIEFNQ
jgi:iron complex outermembrane recepter protein